MRGGHEDRRPAEGEGFEPCSNFGTSAPFTEWVNLGNLSLFHEGKLEWDAKNLNVTNNQKANYGATREYCDGWDPA